MARIEDTGLPLNIGSLGATSRSANAAKCMNFPNAQEDFNHLFSDLPNLRSYSHIAHYILTGWGKFHTFWFALGEIVKKKYLGK